ncbi:MAG: type II secretion system F family protein [Patescibacteria group bacterium]|nr:type II secretion system F family protein [Patescibacteria group bacterium]
MAFFYYKTRNKEGKSTSGMLEAKDERDVAWQLKKEGYFPVLIQQRREKDESRRLFLGFSLFKRVSLKEKMMFTRHLAVMIKGGVGLPQALNILAVQSRSSYFNKVLKDVAESVKKGVALNESLARYPRVFPNVYVSMVEVGELMGRVDETLKILAIQMKKEHDLKSKIKGAMIYPGVVLGAMAGIGVLMMVIVIPRISKIFDELNVQLPLATRILIGTSNFLKEHYFLTLAILAAIVAGISMFLRSFFGKSIVDFLLIKTPYLKGIVIKYNSARFCRSLASLLGGGVPIIRALNIVSDTVSNLYYQKAIKRAANEVKRGVALNSVLREDERIFPALVTQMTKVGEETGMSAEVLKELARFYEQEVDTISKSLSSIVEPILMIILGGAVGFFAISMLQPMYSIVDVIE